MAASTPATAETPRTTDLIAVQIEGGPDGVSAELQIKRGTYLKILLAEGPLKVLRTVQAIAPEKTDLNTALTTLEAKQKITTTAGSVAPLAEVLEGTPEIEEGTILRLLERTPANEAFLNRYIRACAALAPGTARDATQRHLASHIQQLLETGVFAQTTLLAARAEQNPQARAALMNTIPHIITAARNTISVGWRAFLGTRGRLEEQFQEKLEEEVERIVAKQIEAAMSHEIPLEEFQKALGIAVKKEKYGIIRNDQKPEKEAAAISNIQALVAQINALPHAQPESTSFNPTGAKLITAFAPVAPAIPGETLAAMHEGIQETLKLLPRDETTKNLVAQLRTAAATIRAHENFPQPMEVERPPEAAETPEEEASTEA